MLDSKLEEIERETSVTQITISIIFKQHTGWTTVERDVKTKFDLEYSPLEIKTESTIGSNKRVDVSFVDVANTYYAGGISLYFTSPPKYKLDWCTTSYTNFPTELPSGADEIWTIALNNKRYAIILTIYFNNVKVVNVVLSDSTCDSLGWSDVWSRDVGFIQFRPYDTASENYRPGKSNVNT